MSEERETLTALARIQRGALLAGGAALVVAAVGAFDSPDQFFRSYLVAFLFWIGPTLGSLALLLLHDLTGGAWGGAIRRTLEAAARLVPLAALMFVPLLFGLHHLYVWTSADAVAEDALLQHKSAYLDVSFFVVRAVAYFGIWTALVFTSSAFRGREPGADTGRPWRLSGPGLILLGLTVTFSAVDWSMSLEPRWFSSIYPLVVLAGQILQGLAVAILVAAWFRRRSSHRDLPTRAHFNDLGNLCLAFVMIWAYVAFSEYLIIWSGNLPSEVPFYTRRTAGGWQGVVLALVLIHFAVPFVVLLSRKAKRSATVLAGVAGSLLLAHLVHTLWLVQPAFDPEGIRFHWLDVVVPIGLGGIWVGAFAASLRRRPLSALAATGEGG